MSFVAVVLAALLGLIVGFVLGLWFFGECTMSYPEKAWPGLKDLAEANERAIAAGARRNWRGKLVLKHGR